MACVGELDLNILQCAYNGTCSSNGTILAQDAVCSDSCSCANVGDVLAPLKHEFNGTVKRAQNHTLSSSKLASRLTRDAKLHLNFTGQANSTRQANTAKQVNSTRIVCDETMSTACSGVATCCELGLVHSSDINCVTSCACLSPGEPVLNQTGLEWGTRPSINEPVCFGDVVNVERCLENSLCSSPVNGTLLVHVGHEECMSMCSCD